MISFKAHTDLASEAFNVVDLSPSSEREMEIYLYHAEQLLQPCAFDGDDFDSYETFLQEIHNLDFSSSPGYPYCLSGSTIGNWLGFGKDLFLNNDRVQQLWLDTQACLKGEFDVIFKVFIKLEPHKRSKQQTGRWRLILAAPLSFQMACRMVFRHLCNEESEKYFAVPLKHGMSYGNGQWRHFYNYCQEKGLVRGLDVQAFDWSQTGEDIDFDREIRKRLNRGRRTEEYDAAVDKLFQKAYEPGTRVVFSNGLLYEQKVRGINKTGIFTTISFNGHSSLKMHMKYCLRSKVSMFPFPVICGDDTLKHPKHCNIQGYLDIGFVMKTAGDSFEFMGNIIDKEGIYPMYFGKHLVNLCYADSENLGPILDAYLRNYSYDPRYAFFESLARNLGLSRQVRSHASYLHWYDYPT